MAASLGTFFKVHMMFACFKHIGLSVQHDFLSFSWEWPVSIVDIEEMNCILQEDDLQGTILVICSKSQMDILSKDCFHSGIIWLLLEEVYDDSEADLSRLPLNLESNFLTYKRISSGNLELFETYKIKGKFSHRNAFGTWNKNEGITVRNPTVWERRSDLSGVPLVTTILNWEPLMSHAENNVTTVGYFSDILSSLQMQLNFSMKTIRPEDGLYGSLVEEGNGTRWSGMVAQLIEGKADLCAGGLTVSVARSSVIDFSIGLVEDVTSLILINPTKFDVGETTTTINVLAYLTIFTNAAWVAIVLISVMVALTSIVLVLWTRPYPRLTVIFAVKQLVSSLHKFIMSLIQRNNSTTEENSRKCSDKILFMVISMTCFILFRLFECDLTARMTVKDPTPSLRTFDDVLGAGYDLHAVPGSFQHDLIRNAKPGSALHKLYKTRFEAMKWQNYVKKLLSNPTKSAFYTSPFNPEIIRDNDFLHLKSFRDTAISQLAFGLQKSSEFKGIIDHYIIKMVQAGLLKGLMFKWLGYHRPSDYSDRVFNDEAAALGFDKLFFPAAIMMTGIVAAVLIFTVELLNHSCNNCYK